MIENGDKCYVTAKQSHFGDRYPLKFAINIIPIKIPFNELAKQLPLVIRKSPDHK